MAWGSCCKMLNTNSSNFEPKVKELLLERRHSICLEVSKKRRQSVAASIFIPKECIQIEQRLRSTSVPENKILTTSKNGGNQDLDNIKRKNIRRLIKRKKFKNMPFEVQSNRKNIAKRQQILKHPSSYPIVKQTVSSEKVRCAVENLRDAKYEIYTKIFDSKSNVPISTIPINANYVVDNNSLNPTQNLNKNFPIQMEKESASVIENEVPILKSLSNYGSINSADNFVVMMDVAAGEVEIKYAKQPSPFPNDHIMLRDSVEEEKRTHEQASYVETNNRAAMFKSEINIPTNQSNIHCTLIGDNIKSIGLFRDKISKRKHSRRNQEDIIDLSLKDNKSRASSSLSSTCCYSLSNQKPISAPSQKGVNYIRESPSLFDHHHHSFMQEHAYLESPSSTNLRNKQRISSISGINSYSHYLHIHSRNRNVAEKKAFRENYLPSFISSEMCNLSDTKEFWPMAQRFPNQIAFKLDSKAHIQQPDIMNYFPNQLYENCLKPEIYDLPNSHYNHIQQQNKLAYALQTPQTCNIYNYDLPQPLHPPLHRNLYYFPTQYRSTNYAPELKTFEMQQLCDVTNEMPQFTFPETKPTYLPPSPPPPEYLSPTDIPFPPLNWRNTLKKCATPFEISPSNLNISPHIYQSEFYTKTELSTDVHTSTYLSCPNTTLVERMLNNFCPTPELHVNTHSPHLHRDNI